MNPDPISGYTIRHLMSLVRASLWQIPADSQPFTDVAADWNEIGRLAMQQTIGALVADGALRLPMHLHPPKEWLRKGYAMVELNRRTHHLVDSCVAETFSVLTAAGIHPILLKGQAYATAYPDPTLRQCGDIDIFVGTDSYRQAYETAIMAGWESNEIFTPEAKHYGCIYNGVRIELHRTAIELMSGAADRRFQQWSLDQITSGHNSLSIGGKTVSIPTPLFDIIYAFAHMLYHFLNSGTGLRHICDWAMLLHTHSDVDTMALKQLLEDFHLLKSWQRFTPLVVDHLGLTASECPFYSPRYSKIANKILSFIIREGNFGKAVIETDQRPERYLAGKMHSFKKQSARLFSKFHIAPSCVTRHYIGFTQRGVMQVLSDLRKKRGL